MALAKIVYASMTGNTEEIADVVAEKLEALGLEVDIDECTTVDASDFQEADVVIVASYTYGDGELPDEIVDFYDDLQDLDLTGKIFGVVGSGDTFYDEFCKSVDDFEAAWLAPIREAADVGGVVEGLDVLAGAGDGHAVQQLEEIE